MKQPTTSIEKFIARWSERGYEKGETQQFWIELLTEVLGVANASSWLTFEQHVPHIGFIDARIPRTKVLLEQKSADKDLTTPTPQSDGSLLTPFLQAKRYADWLPISEHPRWIVCCNFREFLIYDMEKPQAEPVSILLSDLAKEHHRLAFLVKETSTHLERELQVSLRAGEIIGEIHDALLTQFQLGASPAPRSIGETSATPLVGHKSPTDEHKEPPTQKEPSALNILCVRLVFCFYAEDAGIFCKDQFHDYLKAQDTPHMRRALLDLFRVLDTPVAERDVYLEPELAAFPYVNGGLFREETPIPPFTPRLRQLILKNASLDFNWAEISPTIFGSLFESTLNPETRRAGGMHYTSIENIHKVIDPLFLNALHQEFSDILQEKVARRRKQRLGAFQEKLASLTFLDPACGSGNFLTETYLSLRRLENQVVSARYDNLTFLPNMNPVRVSISQFHGIEVNDFAVSVAQTALWISEAQMLAETERITGHELNFLPLKTNANILEGNALSTPWPVADYILGNPPFKGYSLQNRAQKDDMLHVFGKKWKSVGKLDYVCAWYKVAWEQIKQRPSTRCAFVSTNSITQGEQVAALWKPLMHEGLEIHFAHRTFRWDSEASLKAHVHCVIVGFGPTSAGMRTRMPALPTYALYDADGTSVRAEHINAYLMDAPDVFVESRPKPLCNVPEIVYGNKPTDGGNLFLTKEERVAVLKREPELARFVRPMLGSEEFIKGKERYVLWLKDASPADINRSAELRRRVQAVRDMRLSSPKAATRKTAETPWLFQEARQPTSEYLLLPSVSSERRKYVPIGFIEPEVIASNLVHIIPGATLVHFAVLTSSVHMAWMRAVCGRLEMSYRYSKDVVYNNFPWPPVLGAGVSSPATTTAPATIATLTQTAQAILDTRAMFPDSTLADLYDDLTMPQELRRAHQANDHAVLALYGLKADATEEQIVAELFKRYNDLVARQ